MTDDKVNIPWTIRLRQLLLDPWVPMQEPVLRRNQALSFLVLALLVMGTVVTAIYVAIVPSDPNNILSAVVLLIILVIYFMSRSGYQQAAVLSTFAISTLPIYVMTAPPGGGTEYMMIYLLVPMIIAIFFLSTRLSIVLCVANLTGMLIMGLAFDELSFTETVVGPFSLSLPVVAVLIILRVFNRGTTFSKADDQAAVHFQKLIDFFPSMVAIHRDGHIIYVNRAGRRLLGVDDINDILGKPIKAYFIRDSDTPATAEIIQHTADDLFAMRTIELLKSPNGDQRQVEVISTPILHDGVLATQLIVHDITNKKQNSEALHKLETSYRNVIDLIADYSYEGRFQPDGSLKLVWKTQGFSDLTGYDVDDSLNNVMATPIHEDDQVIVQSHGRMLAQGQSSVTEFRIITKDGRILWLRDHAQPVWDDNNQKVIGFTGTVQNITERAEAEIALKNHALQQAVVAEIGQRALGNPTDWGTLMDEAVTLTAQVLNIEYCKVLELDATGETLQISSYTGWTDNLEQNKFSLDKHSSQAAYTLAIGEPVLSEDLRKEDRFRVNANTSDIQSSLSVVIRGQDRALGVLEGHSRHIRHFALDDVNFMQSIANVLASFLEQKRAYSSEMEHRSMVESLYDISSIINSTLELDEVLDRVLDNLSRVLPYDAASIMVVDDNIASIIRHVHHEKFGGKVDLIYEFQLPIEESLLLAKMDAEQRPIYLPDVREYSGWNVVPSNEWILSYIGAPIIFHGETLGFINVDSASLDAFTDVHADRLMAFANQVSIAIRNARRTQDLEDEVRKRTHELEVERRSIQSILEATGEGIIYTENGEIRYANETFYLITGYNPADLKGCRIGELVQIMVQDDDIDLAAATREQMQTAWNSVASGHIWRGEMRFLQADGEMFEAGLTISKASEIDGVLHAVTVVRDISQIKAVEAEQQRFIADAAHDLRNPIASLSTALYMLERDRENPTRFNRLREIATDMTQLVEELLTLSDIGRGGNFQKLDVILQTLLETEVDIQRDNAKHEKNITLTHDFVLDPVRVYVDPTQIKRVVRNLIANAINYTEADGNGTIKVCIYQQTFDEDPQPEPRRQGQTPRFCDPMAVIAVQDTGRGIAPEHSEKIFRPMFRISKDTKGTGLGLSISREIVRKHGGDIRVESELGAGSTFFVILPLQPTAT